MRKLSRVADSSQYCLLRSESKTADKGQCSSSSIRVRKQRVPEGHLPVYVGEEMERFVVSAELLNHPIFVTLLNKSAQEYGYGYHHQGVLRIPCRVSVFERLLEALRLDAAAHHHLPSSSSPDILEDLFNSLSDHQDLL
ncbi:hypothetical protein ACH5RR_038189 [Cinchona calisaya]|uniref:Uncharacterized protein n=1 Tax=Cinchona calisaya TaxID=153742 RepID=A0ABD2YD30_9GENT